MKAKQAQELLKNLRERGYVEHNNRFYTPAQAAELGLSSKPAKPRRKPGIKTGWTDDYRNIQNKAEYTDTFIQLVKVDLAIEVWPEFYFSTQRNWRIDYFIPDHKIAIEQEGGIFTGGRHTRGVGFLNDMEKYNELTALGFHLIRRAPNQLCTSETLVLIKKIIGLV